MPAVNFSGIASGIDTEGLISATLDAARNTKVKPNETKKTDLEEQSDALSEFQDKLTTLQDSLQPLRLLNGGAVEKVASSSDDSVATATATAGLSNGSYSLTVSQLAEPGRVVFPDNTTGFYADSTTTLFSAATDPTDQVTFTFNPPIADSIQTYTLDVTTSTTAAQFVAALNESSTFSTYAEAALINVGSASDAEYKIVITAKDTGAASTAPSIIQFSSTATLALGAPTVSDGLDAEFTISGISTATISRPTNEITDVISGLTFNLKDTGTAKITVSVDQVATRTKIEAFIEAYNDVVAFLQESNTVERQEDGKEVTNVFGPLAKTSVDENFLQLIRAQISSAQSSSGTAIKIFADIGITTNSNSYDSTTKSGGGTLSLDSDSVSSTLGRTLAYALSTEPDAVAELLQNFADVVGKTDGVIAQFAGFNRLIDSALTSNRTQISDLDSRISEAEKQLSNQETLLRQRYARLESLMGSLQSKQQALTSALAGLG